MTDASDIWYGTSGPRDAEIVIVGESWDQEEDQAKHPFVGSSGTELRRMLAEAGIDVNKVLMTNVVPFRPQNNEMWRLFHAKGTGSSQVGGLEPTERVISGVRNLYSQVAGYPRRLVVGVGAWSLWALSDHHKCAILREYNGRKIPLDLQPIAPTGIGNWRGSMCYMLKDRLDVSGGTGYGTTPLLPIIHPAAIMRDWSQRAVTVHDLKARVPMALRGDWRPNPSPYFLAPPTFQQCTNRLRTWLAQLEGGNSLILTIDIETARHSIITVIGITESTNFAMAIPFVRKCTHPGYVLDSFWNPNDEMVIIKLLRKIVTHKNVRIQGQNFIYDTQYFQWWLAATPRMDFDSMLAQNLLFPGTPKGLDYLSSLYCKYHWYWKDDGKEWDTKGSLEDLLTYNCVDLIRTHEVCAVQRNLIQSYGMTPQWEIKKYQYDLSLRMMERGVRIDTGRRATLTLQLAEAIGAIEAQLTALVPQETVNPSPKVAPWYRSATQTKTLLYDIMGFEVVRDRKTGNPSVKKEALKTLRKKYPYFARILDLLDDYGSADNTATVIQMQLDQDKGHWRARCSYNPAGTETHRLSSSKNVRGGGTNLQNLSKGDEE